jgi:hypothetical protein
VGLQAERERVAALLTAAGLPRVTLDPRNLNPPCVLVGVPATVGRTTVCARTGRLPVFVVAPPPGNADALAFMLTTADTVAATADVESESATIIEVGEVVAPAYLLSVLIYP